MYVPSSGSGRRAALVSAAAAVQQRRDAGEQAEKDQLGDHPHANSVVVA